MLSRRGLLFGAAAVAAPAIIRPGLLMPVKQMLLPGDGVGLLSAAHPCGAVTYDLTEEALLRALMDAWVYVGRPTPAGLTLQRAFGRA
jgi:hypothetical protein